jgi:hypothetical protein
MSEFSSFLRKLIDKDNQSFDVLKHRTLYFEVVYWGQVILNQYQEAIESRRTPIITSQAQEFLKKVATPQIFENPSAYKKAFLEEKAQRYREYTVARQLYRAQVPQLQAQLEGYLLQRSLGTLISLIPGVFLLKEGLPNIWQELKRGSILGALGSFIYYAITSAFSPLGACLNYIGYGLLADNVVNAIAEADASKDYVVTRVLKEDEYSGLKEFRQSFKRRHREAIADNATKIPKPKKHVEKFTEGEVRKVRLYLDKQQAERFDAYQAFRYGHRIDADTFFKGLKSSRMESMATVEVLNIDHEKRIAQPAN